ncbi:MAG: ABC transporter permease [Halobacteriota archaeon]|nr:ABC transporter permease [Halobacteriota archaeon]
MIESLNKSISAMYTLWLREMLHFIRARSRIIGTIVMPLMFLGMLGPGFGMSFRASMMTIDAEFLTPGIIGMTVLFTSLISGVSIIWDREFGFLKEMLIAPVNRYFIVLGKAIGGVTAGMIQGIMIMIIAGTVIGVSYISWFRVIIAIGVMFLIGLGFIGLGIALASRIESHEGFELVMTFIMFPIMILSGAFFPIEGLMEWSEWLDLFARLDPLTYGIDALRGLLLGTNVFSLTLDILVTLTFAIAAIGIGAILFDRAIV